MEKKTELQYQFCSRLDDRKLCSYDREIIDEKTSPILHMTSRVLFVKKGSGIMKVNEKEYPITENTLINLMPFDCTEVVKVDKTLQYIVIKYNFVVINEVFKSLFNVDNEKIPFMEVLSEYPVYYLSPGELNDIQDSFERIRKEVGEEAPLIMGKNDGLSSMMSMNLLMELLIKIERLVTSDEHEENEEEGDDKIAIFRYIYTHLGEKLTLSRLSKQFFLSESSISKYILEATGLTFNNLVNEIRVAKTLNYLMYTDYTLEELASILGYVDAAHISKVFESRVGGKIGEYRRAYQSMLRACNLEEKRLGYDIVSYIVNNYKEEITAQGVAKEFGITVVDLNKILILYVENNFSEFLRRLRIDAACRLLVETDMAITDVAVEVGYNTIKTFNRNFLQYKYVTPGQYRKNTKLEEGEDHDFR